MPHMGSDVTTTEHGSVDYGDYRYQQANFLHKDNSEDGQSGNSYIQFSVEPLQSMGGLQPNEVAELVYLETIVTFEFEDEQGQQEAPQSIETRGVVGANLSSKNDEVQEGPLNGEFTVLEEAGSTDPSTSKSQTQAKDGVFQIYRLQGFPAYKDGSSGTGGGADNPGFHGEKAYRDLTGRGPVLDANDEVTIISRLVAQHQFSVQANIRIHMIWDTAETDEAGRAFSVPR